MTTTVYDASRSYSNFFDHPPAFCAAYAAWIEAHGLDKNATYRVEHHVIDVPFVRVFQYDEDDQGRWYADKVTGDAAVRPPLDVLIRTPPPTPEDYR